MGHIRLGRILTVLTLILAVFPAFVSAMTWYVDPVNGSDSYTGDSPFARPEFGIGPKKTLEGIVGVVSEYDMIVLMDGVHPVSIFPNDVFGEMDRQHLYVCSAGGAENCVIRLGWHAAFNNAALPDMDTVFDGITFESATTRNLDYACISIANNSRIRFMDCVFTGFKTSYPANAYITTSEASTVFENCVFTSNDAATVLNCQWNATVKLENCRFVENFFITPADGVFHGLLYADHCSLELHNCVISNNRSASTFSAIFAVNSTELKIYDSVIENNVSSSDDEVPCTGIRADLDNHIFIQGTRIENLSCENPVQGQTVIGLSVSHPASLNVWDCTFRRNNTGMLVTAEGTDPSNVSINDCEFIENVSAKTPAHSGAGVMLNLQNSQAVVTIRDCTFRANQSGILSSGSQTGVGHVEINHCLFTGNKGLRAAVELLSSSSASHVISYCTLAENSISAIRAANTTVSNSIIRSPFFTQTEGLTFNYCNVSNWTGAGVGNIDADPLFVHPQTIITGGTFPRLVPGTDYHLKSTAGRWDPVQDMLVVDDVDSPCIDAGDPADVPFFEPTGSGGRVNMGVYGNTWQASMTDVCFGTGWRGSGMMFSDINKDCVVNLADYAVMASEWLDSTLAEAPVLY